MRVISMVLGDREIARIEEEGGFRQLVDFTGLFRPDIRQWYEDCFYGVPDSSAFDERFELVREQKYFCWSKPTLQLAAGILKDGVPALEDEIRTSAKDEVPALEDEIGTSVKDGMPAAGDEIGTSIKSVYGMLREVLALYERTECYNTVPAGEKEQDIQRYMGNRLLEVRKEINRLFFGEEKIRAQLTEIVDETEQFVRSYEIPGVVERWKYINPHIVFFDCMFDIEGMCQAETLAADRNRYFEEAKKKIGDEYLGYSEEKAFQNELLRTLTLVFKHDFREYLDPKEPA